MVQKVHSVCKHALMERNDEVDELIRGTKVIGYRPHCCLGNLVKGIVKVPEDRRMAVAVHKLFPEFTLHRSSCQLFFVTAESYIEILRGLISPTLNRQSIILVKILPTMLCKEIPW